MLENQQNDGSGQCMDHGGFSGNTDAGASAGAWQDFSLGNSTDGMRMTWQVCDANSVTQRFYFDLAPSDAAHSNRFSYPGEPEKEEERIVYIYTNEWKQTGPGFYDLVNMHYLEDELNMVQPV